MGAASGRSGLSPRSRGSPAHELLEALKRGSIPALAGKPSDQAHANRESSVYPRARGEACVTPSGPSVTAGLSPRSRGSPIEYVTTTSLGGSIPALAGKPQPPEPRHRPGTVYPRARGEARGHRDAASACLGLSPRSRGSLSWPGLGARVRGSIPALAGKPSDLEDGHGEPQVYPRARGEADTKVAIWVVRMGLSPRSRGSRGMGTSIRTSRGSIPALAGKPHRDGTPPVGRWVYPRARGEAHSRDGIDYRSEGLSPRSRGSLCRNIRYRTPTRSIPALAGKPMALHVRYELSQVYPRARGEALTLKDAGGGSWGLSPRSRGSPWGNVVAWMSRRSIPALAGKPATRSRYWAA